jgi:hypothetical protein
MKTQVALTQNEIVNNNTVINKQLQELNIGQDIFKSWEYSSERISDFPGQPHYILWSAKKIVDTVEVEVMFDGISYRIDLNYNNGSTISFVNNTGNWKKF